MSYGAIVRDDSITFIIENKTYKVLKTDTIFEKVKEAHLNNDPVKIKELIDIGSGLVNYAQGSVIIKDGVVFWNGEEMHNAITKRMIRMMQEGYSIDFLIRFLNNVMENPSATSVKELYIFLDHNELPITPDGHFLAYKKVREDYTDIHSGKFDNSVGQVREMRRNDVDDNRTKTCSQGLHFCSKNYLHCYGSNGSGARVMVVKINPRDVVSIPNDYNNAKGRCCLYEVVGEWEEWYLNYKKDQDAILEKNVVNNNYNKQDVSDRPRDSQGRFISKTKVMNQSFDEDMGDIEVTATGHWRSKTTGRYVKKYN